MVKAAEPITGELSVSFYQYKCRPAYVAVVACVVMTTILWGNLFRFHPEMIDRSYDATSEGLVIGRLARAAADGLLKNTDLGLNGDPQLGIDNTATQTPYFEHPDLIQSLRPTWMPYASQFGFQGLVFSVIDLLNPLPRHLRIGFYHLLASLFAAATLVWIASILRMRFGWPAFVGFLLPIAFEPMFSALAPNRTRISSLLSQIPQRI